MFQTKCIASVFAAARLPMLLSLACGVAGGANSAAAVPVVLNSCFESPNESGSYSINVVNDWTPTGFTGYKALTAKEIPHFSGMAGYAVFLWRWCHSGLQHGFAGSRRLLRAVDSVHGRSFLGSKGRLLRWPGSGLWTGQLAGKSPARSGHRSHFGRRHHPRVWRRPLRGRLCGRTQQPYLQLYHWRGRADRRHRGLFPRGGKSCEWRPRHRRRLLTNRCGRARGLLVHPWRSGLGRPMLGCPPATNLVRPGVLTERSLCTRDRRAVHQATRLPLYNRQARKTAA